MRFRFLFLYLFLTPLACTGAGFSGGTQKNEPPSKKPLLSSENPSENPRTSPSQVPCTEKTQINSELLTPTIKNGAADLKIKYSISLTSCDGSPREVEKGTLLFDIDVIRDPQKLKSGLPYTFKVGKKSSRGIFQALNGSDLFGNTGQEFYHYENREAVLVPPGEKTATLEVSLDGETLAPRQGSPNADGSFTFQTLLKFGPPDPVTHKIKAL